MALAWLKWKSGGSLNGTHFFEGKIKQCKSMESLRKFPLYCSALGLGIHGNPVFVGNEGENCEWQPPSSVGYKRLKREANLPKVVVMDFFTLRFTRIPFCKGFFAGPSYCGCFHLLLKFPKDEFGKLINSSITLRVFFPLPVSSGRFEGFFQGLPTKNVITLVLTIASWEVTFLKKTPTACCQHLLLLMVQKSG